MIDPAWKTGDKAWMAERKRQWRLLQKDYEGMDQSVRQQRDYFLYGAPIPSDPKHWRLTRFRFHPDRSEAHWRRIYSEFSEPELRRTGRSLFWNDAGRWNALEDRGGWEPMRLFRLFNGERYIETPTEEDGIRRIPPSDPPAELFRTWIAAVSRALSGQKKEDARFPLACHGYFTSLLPYIPDEAFEKREIRFIEPTPVDQLAWSIQSMLIKVDQFVEPKGLPGEDTSARRCRDAVAALLDQGLLGRRAEATRCYINSEAARARDLAFSEPKLANANECGRVLLKGDAPPPVEIVQRVREALVELDFVEPLAGEWIPRPVDLSGDISTQMREALGYAVGVPLPAWCYEAEATARFKNCSTGSFQFSLLLPIPVTADATAAVMPGAFFCVRADKPYCYGDYFFGGIGVAANIRLLIRLLHLKYGVTLRVQKSYFGDEDVASYAGNAEPLDRFDGAGDDQHRRSSFPPFPSWTGAPLPPPGV